jgi:glucokinase
MYEYDQRIIMTLDAGGTGFRFTAIKGNVELFEPFTYPSYPSDLDKCLEALKKGFEDVKKLLPYAPAAISFAFPGPADYKNGIIGDLPNFPSFRGGVALGPFLEHHFKIPVFINNDGNLFAYGEAISGALVDANRLLAQYGSARCYKNLLGVTLGTGFGAGVVIDGNLLSGDNGCGGDVWVFRNKKHIDMICEESVSIRAVKRVYGELTGNYSTQISPKDIFDIAEGVKEGDQASAIRSFEILGEIAGDVISQALTIVDGLVVIGGGLAGAAKYFVPAMAKEMGSSIKTFSGDVFPRLQMKAYNLDNLDDVKGFVEEKNTSVTVPGTDIIKGYNQERRAAFVISKLGASRAISLGAYAFAITELDRIG